MSRITRSLVTRLALLPLPCTQRRGLGRGNWRRGIFLAEAVIAMGVIVLLAAVLTTAATQHRKGSDRLAETRQAIRLAEQTLTALQTGKPAPTAPQGSTIAVIPLDTGWVSVRVTHHGRKAELAGPRLSPSPDTPGEGRGEGLLPQPHQLAEGAKP